MQTLQCAFNPAAAERVMRRNTLVGGRVRILPPGHQRRPVSAQYVGVFRDQNRLLQLFLKNAPQASVPGAAAGKYHRVLYADAFRQTDNPVGNRLCQEKSGDGGFHRREWYGRPGDHPAKSEKNSVGKHDFLMKAWK